MLSMQPRLQSSWLRDKPSESSSILTAGTAGTRAVAAIGIAYRCPLHMMNNVAMLSRRVCGKRGKSEAHRKNDRR